MTWEHWRFHLLHGLALWALLMLYSGGVVFAQSDRVGDPPSQDGWNNMSAERLNPDAGDRNSNPMAGPRAPASPGQSSAGKYKIGHIKIETRNRVESDITVSSGSSISIGNTQIGGPVNEDSSGPDTVDIAGPVGVDITGPVAEEKDESELPLEEKIKQICQDSQDEDCEEKQCLKNDGCFFIDGCSNPLRGSLDAKNVWGLFGSFEGCTCEIKESLPCNNHDVCYQTCGSNQMGCDLKMLRDMVKACGDLEGPAPLLGVGWVLCHEQALEYYYGLVSFGWLAHLKRQAKVCR